MAVICSNTEICDATNFYLARLIPQARHNISVNMVPVFNNPHTGSDGGLIIGQTFSLSSNRYRLEYYANTYGAHIPLLTIAHECVHVSQFVRDRLTVIGDSTYWDGVYYPTPNSESEYRALPWEKEAEARERGLYRDWLSIAS